jgi:hypothetical protein
MKVHHFRYDNIGYFADWWDADDICWDKEGDTGPTEGDINEARDHWKRDGYNAAMEDAAAKEADRRKRLGD